jgi:hypothetical protein
MSTATRTTARDEIRALADARNWAVDGTSNWHDRFIRGAELPEGSPLARFFAVADFAPCDLIMVRYDDLGRVTELHTAGPGQQSALMGTHGHLTEHAGTGKRAAALALLNA